MKPEPFRIEPTFVPRIWGARSLAPLYPEKTNLSEPIGEVWLTGVDCEIATGPFAGKTLGEAWREMPAEWRGTRFEEPGDFPILIKFIFPNDKLSIQVHPDDAYAAAHEQVSGGRGKTEMWHVISSEPDAHVFVGTKPGVSKQQFLEAIKNQTLENLLEKHPVHNGDTFFVPAGTPHTIGPGMVLCEVQEYSDLTYRVYDYGRVDAQGKPRELHVEKALDVVKFGNTTAAKVPCLRLWSGDERDGGGNRTLLSACRYFTVERWELYERFLTYQQTGLQFDIHVVLGGSGQYGWREADTKFQPGQCWFIPACLSGMPSATRHTAMLRAYIPDLNTVRSDLRVQHHSEAEIARTVFV